MTCELCATFRELPAPVPFQSLQATSISGNGRVVVGQLLLGAQTRSFRWSWRDGQTSLEQFPDDATTIASYATSANSDGSVVVGYTELATDSTVTHAFRWSALGPGYLPEPAGGTATVARDVSADGQVVVGAAQNASGSRALRWEGTTIEDLGDLLGSGGEARRVSADGRVIVGDDQGSGNQRAFWFSWPEMRFENLGVLPGDSTSSARGVNADGSIVVGQSFGGFASTNCPGTGLPPQIFSAFRWTSTGLSPLDSAMCGVGAQAFNLSANGKVAVGIVQIDVNTAVLWDDRGMTSIAARLDELGVSAVSGWVLNDVGDVSDDGRVIVGSGTNPGGSVESWVAVLGKDCSASTSNALAGR